MADPDDDALTRSADIARSHGINQHTSPGELEEQDVVETNPPNYFAESGPELTDTCILRSEIPSVKFKQCRSIPELLPRGTIGGRSLESLETSRQNYILSKPHPAKTTCESTDILTLQNLRPTTTSELEASAS